MQTLETLIKSSAEAVLSEVSAERQKNATERGALHQKDIFLDGVGEGVRCFVEEFTKQLKNEVSCEQNISRSDSDRSDEPEGDVT